MRLALALLPLLLSGGSPSPAATGASPSTEDARSILRKHDQVMGPAFFEAEATMTAHRTDGSERTYQMRFLKGGDDRFRVWFDAPSNARGQEILRVEDNFWVYMPNLKRAVRLAARESFMGGDFNNADVLRVSYAKDFDPTITSETEDCWVLSLKSHNPGSAYDRIELTVHKGDYLPIEGHYFAASGKELRAAEFKDPKDFRGHRRPGLMTMRNSIEEGRWSRMELRDFKVVESISSTRFVLTELGK
ncbi:MAG: outer membrane lipoprotein-sorting protein [Deltaproteobacteria bacterium]|nr:outer membrane lipoprotein-sorting protein [Deltaproteobacteria bacterium]